jgi:hypothetical protein
MKLKTDYVLRTFGVVPIGQFAIVATATVWNERAGSCRRSALGSTTPAV